MAIIGTFILAFGWFGFNPGSTLGAVGAGCTTEFFRAAKAPVFRFFVPFVAFCRPFRAAGGNEELAQGF